MRSKVHVRDCDSLTSEMSGHSSILDSLSLGVRAVDRGGDEEAKVGGRASDMAHDKRAALRLFMPDAVGWGVSVISMPAASTRYEVL